jgi:hypothetical protein
MAMPHISADHLAEQLKQRANLLRIEHAGNTKIWFSTEIPNQLPVQNKVHHVATERVALPYHHYFVTANSLAGWMTFWRHVGPRCVAATAFISISPLNSKQPIAEYEMTQAPANLIAENEAHWLYGFESENYLSYFCAGLTHGLLVSYLGHPLADVKISILNALSHRVDSSPKAFELLGQWLMEAMVFELYKRDWIQKS